MTRYRLCACGTHEPTGAALNGAPCTPVQHLFTYLLLVHLFGSLWGGGVTPGVWTGGGVATPATFVMPTQTYLNIYRREQTHLTGWMWVGLGGGGRGLFLVRSMSVPDAAIDTGCYCGVTCCFSILKCW